MSEAEAKRAQAPNWAALRYLVGSIQYGGRVTDALDRRVLETLVEHYYSQSMLLRGASLHPGAPIPGAFAIPDAMDVEAFQRAVDALPETESPELFGLHPSADAASRTTQASVSFAVLCTCTWTGCQITTAFHNDNVSPVPCHGMMIVRVAA